MKSFCLMTLHLYNLELLKIIRQQNWLIWHLVDKGVYV